MEMRNNSSGANQSPFGPINAPPFNLGLVIILSALIPIAVAGNSLVCFAFIKYQKVRTATNCFLFSLAISDLAVGLLLIPLWIAYIATGGFHELPLWFHNSWNVLDVTCSVASMVTLTGVSIERWYGVCYPFRHMSMSINYAILTLVSSWVYALGVGSLLFLYNLDNLWPNTAIICLGLFLPFVIVIISYCAIARKIRQKSLGHPRQSGKECKTIRTLIVLSAIFVICWLPFAVGTIIVNYCDQCALYVLERPVLHIFPKVLHYSNSCINPIIYSLFCPSFKAAFGQMFYGPRRTPNGRGRLNTDPSGSGSNTKRSSIVISFKEKRKSTYSDGERRESFAIEKCVHL